jgi:hypothetical protein
MTNYTFAQLEGIWLQASQGTKYDTQAFAALMAAIALAESSGNPNSTNPTDNNGSQTSWGLWQISNGTHASVSPSWNNPVTNAQLAIQKLNSQGLAAWGTYDSGAYKKYLQGNVSPAAFTGAVATAGSSSTSSGGVVQDVWSWIQDATKGVAGVASAPFDIGQSIASLATPFVTITEKIDWLFHPSHWIRIIAFGGGVLFLGFGIWGMTHVGEGPPVIGSVSYQGMSAPLPKANLPMGMLSTGIGGVLLFVAFHNVPDSVQNFQQFVGWIFSNVKLASPAGSSAGASSPGNSSAAGASSSTGASAASGAVSGFLGSFGF